MSTWKTPERMVLQRYKLPHLVANAWAFVTLNFQISQRGHVRYMSPADEALAVTVFGVLRFRCWVGFPRWSCRMGFLQLDMCRQLDLPTSDMQAAATCLDEGLFDAKWNGHHQSVAW